MDNLAIGLPLLPLLAALLIGGGQAFGRGREAFTATLTLATLALATLLGAFLTTADLLGKSIGVAHFGTWLKSEDLSVALNLVTAGFKIQTATICALLLLVVARYSAIHLRHEAGFQRYFLAYNCFAAALFLLLLSDNLLLIFVGWYTTCVCAYSVIAYAYAQPVAAFNATRVFLAHRLGDACLLLGIGFSYSWLGSVNLADINPIVMDLELNESTTLALCFATAAGVRSAQFPFSAWLTRAMEGTSASNGVFFGAIFSHSGVFLLITLRHVLEQSPLTMTVIIVLGALTALYGWVTSLTQTDLNSALSFAIVGQLGLIFMECGLGWWQVAAIHTLVHAVLRIYQLLYAPGFLQQTLCLPASPLLPRLAKMRWGYVVSLQRFWLDPLTDWLLVNPILRLGKDLSYFDDHIVNALMGTPAPAMNALATLAQLEEQRQGGQADNEAENFAKGSGLAGKLAQAVAVILQWLEEYLLKRTLHDGMLDYGGRIGRAVIHIEQLLLRPRYLSLFVFITLLVVF